MKIHETGSKLKEIDEQQGEPERKSITNKMCLFLSIQDIQHHVCNRRHLPPCSDEMRQPNESQPGYNASASVTSLWK